MKTKQQSGNWSNEFNQIGVARIRRFPFSYDCTYDSIAYDLVKTRLSQAEVQEKPITMFAKVNIGCSNVTRQGGRTQMWH